MKNFIIFGLFICTNLFAKSSSYSVSKSIYNNKGQPFISHMGDEKFDSYLSMEIVFGPVRNLFETLQKEDRKALETRGEAHITVITPVEYFEALSSKLSMEDINKIAQSNEIQKSDFTIVCLGKGQVLLDNVLESTYFIVVSSKALLEIRKKIAALFYSRGGEKSDFNPDHFFPHITLGFTKRDLHESDGVVKDRKSCIAPILLL